MNRGRGAGARRRRQQDKRLLIVAGAVIAVLVVIVIIFAVTRGSRQDGDVTVEAPVATESMLVLDVADNQDEEIVLETPEPEPEIVDEPAEGDYSYNAVYRPQAEEGFLPVFSKSDTQDKIVAVTLDDCSSAETLATMIDLFINNGAKLTLFPIGEDILDSAVGSSLKYAWENGFELENHTMTHNGLYNCTAEELAYEVFQQNATISDLLGVEYQVHFLRPKGCNARNDQRIHAYIRQLDYDGIAYWSYSGSSNDLEDIKASLAPGQIYQFHTREADLGKLMEFVPFAIQEGYTFVTLNEMFGYAANETSALVTGRVMPELEPYTEVPVTYRKTTYAYGAMLLQHKLIGLGYLTGTADGVYGADSANAVKVFQESVGLEATGAADPETQAKIDELYKLKFPNEV